MTSPSKPKSEPASASASEPASASASEPASASQKPRQARVPQPSDPSKSLDEELIEMLRYLRLGNLLTNWDELLAAARKGRYSGERLLKHVLEEECRTKRENARLLRRQRANIPERLEMETFPFSRQPKLDRKKILSYYDSFEYMSKQRNMVWMGPTGCGKTSTIPRWTPRYARVKLPLRIQPIRYSGENLS